MRWSALGTFGIISHDTGTCEVIERPRIFASTFSLHSLSKPLSSFMEVKIGILVFAKPFKKGEVLFER